MTRQLPMGAGYCQWVDLLNEICVIYMETHTSHRAIARCLGARPIRILKIRPLGPLAAAGERVTHTLGNI